MSLVVVLPLPVALTVTTNPSLTDVDVLFVTVTSLDDNEYPVFAVFSVYDIVGVANIVLPDVYVPDCDASAIIVFFSPAAFIR